MIMSKDALQVLDEQIAVMQAYREGKKIQRKMNVGDDDWEDAGIPCWNWTTFDYRIKPKEDEYRSYQDETEFMAAYKEHGPFLKKDGYYLSISYFDNVCIDFSLNEKDPDTEVLYSELLNHYTWQDGHKCGILK